MKNEELFELMSQLKVDDEYIEDALVDDFDGRRPVKVYAGKTKLTPMRIIAPVAACLAVVAAAGFVLSNMNSINKLPIGPANAGSEVTSEADTGTSVAALTEEELIEKCKSIVEAENEAVANNAVWETFKLDIDFDGEEELMLNPNVKGVGVRVFKKTAENDIRDIGAFGTDVGISLSKDSITPNDIFGRNGYYYIYVTAGDESCATDIHEISFDENTNKVKDVSYLKYVTTRSNETLPTKPFLEKAYRYGKEISVDTLFFEVSGTRFGGITRISDWDGMAKFDTVLAEKYNMPLADIKGLTHAISQADVNGDGRDEVFIRFENSEQLCGFYVFSVTADNEAEFLGEIVPDGKIGYGDAEYNGEKNVHRFEDGGESYCYFLSVNAKDDGSSEAAVNKIIVNDDGTFGFEAIVVHIREKLDDGTIKSHYLVNGKEVTQDEFSVIRDKYGRK